MTASILPREGASPTSREDLAGGNASAIFSHSPKTGQSGRDVPGIAGVKALMFSDKGCPDLLASRGVGAAAGYGGGR